MNFSEQFVGNCKHKGVVEDFLWSRPASFFEQSETTKETTLEEITGPETGDGMSGETEGDVLPPDTVYHGFITKVSLDSFLKLIEDLDLKFLAESEAEIVTPKFIDVCANVFLANLPTDDPILQWSVGQLNITDPTFELDRSVVVNNEIVLRGAVCQIQN